MSIHLVCGLPLNLCPFATLGHHWPLSLRSIEHAAMVFVTRRNWLVHTRLVGAHIVSLSPVDARTVALKPFIIHDIVL